MTEQSLKTGKADILWNMVGSLIYAFSSMAMAFFALRLFGPDDGGVFGFGFSTLGQHIFIIAYFGIRPLHITDTKGEYSFGDYLYTRKLTSLLALVFSALYLTGFSFFGDYGPYKAAAILLLCAYKAVDGYADVYESECQRNGKLYIGGRALFFRSLVSMLTFLFCAALTGSLLISAFLGLCAQIFGLFVFNIRGFLSGVSLSKTAFFHSMKRSRSLLLASLPLFLSTFLDFYIFSSAKYAIDWFMNDGASGIFNILFMPTNVIYLMANFIIKPFMTELAAAFEQGDRDRFLLFVRRIAFIIIGLTAAAFVLSLLLSGPVLGIFELLLGKGYEGQLYAQRMVFSLIILGGGIYALNNLFYYILVIMRRQIQIFFIYLIGSVLALGLSMLLVGAYGMLGGALSYLVLMLLMLGIFAIVSIGAVKKGFVSGRNNNDTDKT